MGSNNNYNGGDIIQVLEIMNHPQYDPSTSDYDFSILRLLTPIIFDGKTKASIKLPPANDPIRDGTKVFVTGWGETNNFDDDADFMLRAVTVQVVSQTECARSYAINKEIITTRMVCAKTAGKDSCQVRIYIF